ncbi:hypothetical protein [Vandammella animalimorsus]|uniref:GFA family protein n=1 Tax=Vandammella animalimorsus TaxID=2029117 RepID=UPI001EEF57C4|nr:hypothetical protein [Vandammella animalimorsus]
MTPSTSLTCRCGQTRMEVIGAPFMVTECLCNSCRAAAARLATLAQAHNLLTPLGVDGNHPVSQRPRALCGGL